MAFSRSFTTFVALSCVLPGALAGVVQVPNLMLPNTAAGNLTAAKALFTTSYDAYKKYAFGHDDLSPVSESFNDGRNGWGASIADAMSTMLIMGLIEDFEDAVNYTSTISFATSKTDASVSVFETTIRYVAGYLSAYQLSNEQYPILLQKAQEVADKLQHAWVGLNVIPYGELNFTTNTPFIGTSNIAEAGTLTLEYYLLSQYTKNDTYRAHAENAVRHLIALPSQVSGIPGQGIDPTTGLTSDAYITWGGGSDSYLEYLIKYPRLTNTADQTFANAWHTAVDSSIKKLLVTSSVGNWSYLSDINESGNTQYVGSHLACFYPGNWMLGAKLMNNATIYNLALELNEACWNTYASTATGIGPETFNYVGTNGGAAPPSASQAFYNTHGFYIGASDYILRPEVLESNFYAWRTTGNTKYLDRAASAITAFQKVLNTTVAYTGINDVNNPTGGGFIDDMESFWFAEVLKYLYLTFDDPNHISLDEYVWNTECHPFKAPAALPVYGNGSYIPSLPFVPTGVQVPRPAISQKAAVINT